MRIIAAVVGLVSTGWLATANAQDACAKLISLQLPNTTITAAQTVAAGDFPTPVPAPGVPPLLVKLAAHCRVTGAINPTADSDIHFEVWLPVTDWNHRYQQVGNGGLAGSIMYWDMVGALRRGSATASTDDGHVGSNPFDAGWVPGHPEKVIDYGDRAVHLTALAGEAIVQAYYAEKARHTYFTGCSDGGRESLMEAQRYPQDFDGYLVGAPGIDIPGSFISILHAQQALQSLPAGEQLGSAQLATLAAKAVERCDSLDGVKDGVLADPRRCDFNPRELICKGAASSSCLTPAQATAVQQIYDGPKDSTTGEQVAPGRLTNMGTEDRSWPGILIGTPMGPPLGAFIADQLGTLLYGSPGRKPIDLDATQAARDAKKLDPIMNPKSPDLRAARQAGNKILQYHGWADPNVPPQYSVRYFEGVQKFLGSDTQDFYRLFMVPGMAHCAGGIGPTSIGGIGIGGGTNRGGAADNSGRPGAPEFDFVSALERWVEEDVAPKQLVVTEFKVDGPSVFVPDGAPVKSTRPLCPYPQVAVYKGTGSADDAANFHCEAPPAR